MTRSYRKSPELEAKRFAAASEMAELHSGGMSLAQVASQYSLSRAGAANRLKKYGFRVFANGDRGGGYGLDVERRETARIARLDAQAGKKWGCSFAQYLELRRMRKPTRAFQYHQRNAWKRGVEWRLTLWQWWTIWDQSGHWSDRGTGQGHYVMCRKGDIGPYEPDNVYIALSIHNNSVKPSKKSDLPMGVLQRRNRFRAARMIDGKLIRLGWFDTAQEASEAYEAAYPSRAVEMRSAAA